MEKDKIICWRGSDGDIEPVKCICVDKFGYPNDCRPEGGMLETMYENTHFLKKDDAWRSIVQSTKADISLCGRDVVRKRDELLKTEKLAADALSRYLKIKDNFENPFSNKL